MLNQDKLIIIEPPPDAGPITRLRFWNEQFKIKRPLQAMPDILQRDEELYLGCVDISLSSIAISIDSLFSVSFLRAFSRHFERSEKSKIGDWRVYNDLRFFTPLRCVQNDRTSIHFKSKTLCVSNVNTP